MSTLSQSHLSPWRYSRLLGRRSICTVTVFERLSLTTLPISEIEKLAALWLEVSEHREQKQYEKMVDEVLKRQIDTLPQVAAGRLKFRAVLRNIRLPLSSAFQPLMMARSARMPRSRI